MLLVEYPTINGRETLLGKQPKIGALKDGWAAEMCRGGMSGLEGKIGLSKRVDGRVAKKPSRGQKPTAPLRRCPRADDYFIFPLSQSSFQKRAFRPVNEMTYKHETPCFIGSNALPGP